MQVLRKHGLLIIIMLVVLALRFSIWRHTSIFLYGDMYRFDAMARHLVQNGYLGIGSIPDAYYTPGYSLFLAIIYKFSMWVHGGQLIAIHSRAQAVYLIQQILSSGTILLVYILGKLLQNRYVGLAAAIITALYLPTSFVGELLLSENLFIPFLLLTLVFAVLALCKKQGLLFALTGAAVGVSALIRPLVLPMLFFFIAAVFWQSYRDRLQNPRPLAQGLRFSCALGVGATLVLLPWWVRNFALFHRFVPLSTEAGNPLLAGAYPYFQVPFDQLAETAKMLHVSQETYAIHLIAQGFSQHFFWYLGWFLFGKLYYLFWSPWLYNGLGWLVLYHRLLVLLGGPAVVAGLFFRKGRVLSASILFLLALQLVFLPIARYGYPFVVLMGVAIPVQAANLLTLLRRRARLAEK